MISITEIVLIIAGFAAIIIGYLLPAGKELDEEDKMLMEREIRELVRREVEEQKDTIEDMVGDSVENSLDRTERAMERISNEKMSAIGEYSDTVINDIHKNHDEVLFMYDMLNDKHKNLTSVVSEVTRKADEAKQVVLDAELTAREAQEATISYKEAAKVQEPLPLQQTQQVIQPQQVVQPQQVIQPQQIVQPQPVEQPQPQNVRAVLLDELDDKLSGIRIPYSEEKNIPQSPKETEISFADKNFDEPEPLKEIPAKVISQDMLNGLHVIGGKSEKEEVSSKVVPITEAVRVEARSKNPDSSMKELTAKDPVSQNKQIIEMHKAGKSNMVIARELGLGIGEVKLVIDLSNKHRKVR